MIIVIEFVVKWKLLPLVALHIDRQPKTLKEAASTAVTVA